MYNKKGLLKTACLLKLCCALPELLLLQGRGPVTFFFFCLLPKCYLPIA